MNINERLGITSKDDMPFREKYGKVVDLIGLENLKPLMPEDIETLAKKYEKDNNLNNIPIERWDAIAGYSAFVDKSGRQLYRSGNSSLKSLLQKNSINEYSPAQLVCILKEAAAEIVEEYNQEKSNIDILRDLSQSRGLGDVYKRQEKYNGKMLTTTEEVLKFDKHLEKAMRMSLPEDVSIVFDEYDKAPMTFVAILHKEEYSALFFYHVPINKALDFQFESFDFINQCPMMSALTHKMGTQHPVALTNFEDSVNRIFDYLEHMEIPEEQEELINEDFEID